MLAWLVERQRGVALTVFVIVVAVGLWRIDFGPVPRARETTTVATPAVPAKPATTTTTTTGTGRARQVTKERTSGTPAVPASTTTTTKTSPRTGVERLLGDDGVVVLQYGLLLLAAFVAAAAAQRVLMGRYGFKFAGLELEDVGESAADGLAALNSKLMGETSERLHSEAELRGLLTLALTRIAQLEADPPEGPDA